MPILFTSLVASKILLLGRFALKRIRPMLETHLNFVRTGTPWSRMVRWNRVHVTDIMMSFPPRGGGGRGVSRE